MLSAVVFVGKVFKAIPELDLCRTCDKGFRFEMTSNYRMIVERYPNLNGGVDGLIPCCKIFSLFDEEIKSMPTAR